MLKIKSFKNPFFKGASALFLFTLYLSLNACVSSSSTATSSVDVDINIQIDSQGLLVLNPQLADDRYCVIDYGASGKQAVLPDRLVVDGIPAENLDAFLEKYHAQLISEGDIYVEGERLVGLDGEVVSGKLIQLDLSQVERGYLEESINEGTSDVPLAVSHPDCESFLEINARIDLEDRETLSSKEPVCYGVENSDPSP